MPSSVKRPKNKNRSPAKEFSWGQRYLLPALHQCLEWDSPELWEDGYPIHHVVSQPWNNLFSRKLLALKASHVSFLPDGPNGCYERRPPQDLAFGGSYS